MSTTSTTLLSQTGSMTTWHTVDLVDQIHEHAKAADPEVWLTLTDLPLGIYERNPTVRMRNTTTWSAAHRPQTAHKKSRRQADAARLKALGL
jgi:hypothetical protein